MKLAFITGIGLLFIVALVASCQSDEQVEFNRYYSGGSVLYLAHCQNCHGEKGEGLQALIPPLTDSVFMKQNRPSLACYIKNGLKGKLSIVGREFEGEMPAAADLSPIEIAKVLTYVTNSFGNKQGLIDLQQVQADLKNCR
ncbi:c-type cytochrome [Mucilaginibacter lappiensis]|uniref:Mono/diheme cytochrome c family protein n=1 Tax=Mucilaginibacter lappiensis TaxID=354630 RepID=A0A1N6X1C7_9SPHI|nr:cytochrome c [Mucilaginibacter lappiensis]MBB6109422.1 mono/diheme cytochrome c family protein [Mucilaginibacter lappiensis]MBB6127660.1 mono/diheme cytochrome c family protein [Mucilaginibacter lappiensis]SIQ96123.1 Cytochrome C oxidase, cbb3-type, subunit III [Mucilaginibacter lappiensis]